MTVLSACQDACLRLLGRKPATIYSDTTFAEIGQLANETAEDIAKSHDWQALRVLYTLTGDGSTTYYSLPDDYDRLLINAYVQSTRSRIPLARARDQNQWLDFLVSAVLAYPGYWIILGGQMQILPALGSSETAKFYYMTTKWAEDSGGTAKTSFEADTDVFRLPERLLRLGLIWRYRQRKGLEYGEDMANYEKAFAQEAARDRGVGTFGIGRSRLPPDATVAYPGVIIP